MDDHPCRLFFLQPAGDSQRLYEALRAVFVDGCRQKDVAERFGYDYAAFRQQVHQFRTTCAAGQTPPFLRPEHAADRRLPSSGRRGNRSRQTSLTVAPST